MLLRDRRVVSQRYAFSLPLFFPNSGGLKMGWGEVGRPGARDGGRATVRVLAA
jgi:hypothetical protein